MGHLWGVRGIAHEVSEGFSSVPIRGELMSCLWATHGLSVGHPCAARGSPMGCPWAALEMRMNFAKPCP